MVESISLETLPYLTITYDDGMFLQQPADKQDDIFSTKSGALTIETDTGPVPNACGV